MTAPALSVVIPIYNRARIVGAAVDSVLTQDFTDFELLIVDDGSTDDLAAALARFDDPRLRLLPGGRNGGAAAARNRGIAAARGAMIAFLDSDDVWLPALLAARIAFLDAQPDDAQVVLGGILRHDLTTGRTTPRSAADGDSVERVLFGCDLNPGSTLIARRTVFARVGGFDERLERLEDWDWFLRYLAIGRLRVFPAPVALINVAPRPVVDAVRRAGAALRCKHREPLKRLHWSYPWRFESGLKTEEAGAAYAARRPVRAAVALFLAMAFWPPRVLAIGRRLVRRFLPSL